LVSQNVFIETKDVINIHMNYKKENKKMYHGQFSSLCYICLNCFLFQKWKSFKQIQAFIFQTFESTT